MDNHNFNLFVAVLEGDINALRNALESGKSPNTLFYSYTPLHFACCSKNKQSVEITKLLIDKGSDVNARTKRGNTPLHFAAQDGHYEILKLLLDHGADVNAKSYDAKSLDELEEIIEKYNKHKKDSQELVIVI